MIQYNSEGLIPAIVQDVYTKEVLMLAYMNEQSYHKTLETKTTWFYSRSRQCLWNKGSTSGHIQHVKALYFDCDQDTLLVLVEQEGNIACHTGAVSCFFNEVTLPSPVTVTKALAPSSDCLSGIYDILLQRKQEPIKGSYTNYLFDEGIDKIGKKIGEEAMELVIAAKNNNNIDMVDETSDLLYHILVLLVQQGVSYQQVVQELETRQQKIANLKVQQQKGAL